MSSWNPIARCVFLVTFCILLFWTISMRHSRLNSFGRSSMATSPSSMTAPLRLRSRPSRQFLVIVFIVVGIGCLLISTLTSNDGFILFIGILPSPGMKFTERPNDPVYCWNETHCFHTGPDGDFHRRTGQLRRALKQKFMTAYGCPNDPAIRYMKELVNWSPGYPVSNRSRVQAKQPIRISLLFMISKGLSHPEIWDEWLTQAKKWSLQLYQEEIGPYATLDQTEKEKLKNDDIFLFSIRTHISKNFGGSRMPLPVDLASNRIPEVENEWGALTMAEFQLLKYSLEDERNSGFIFISDTTVPVKPFSYIYDEFQKNPRSRFFFNNVNLPLVRKHDQWIVLSRRHAVSLVEHPNLWTCGEWFTQPYARFLARKVFAAADEYLPFHALSETVGISSIWAEVNDGKPHLFPVLNWNANSPIQYSGLEFQHTWVCWVRANSCGDLGKYIVTAHHSPVRFRLVYSNKFEAILLENPNVWFARKFDSNCQVQLLSESELENYGLSASSSSHQIPLETWLNFKLSQFSPKLKLLDSSS